MRLQKGSVIVGVCLKNTVWAEPRALEWNIVQDGVAILCGMLSTFEKCLGACVSIREAVVERGWWWW